MGQATGSPGIQPLPALWQPGYMHKYNWNTDDTDALDFLDMASGLLGEIR